jgi:hypothetical protein
LHRFAHSANTWGMIAPGTNSKGNRPAGASTLTPSTLLVMPGMLLGTGEGSARWITFESAAPTQGAFAAGEIIFNNGAGTVFAWKCTTAGYMGPAWAAGAISGGGANFYKAPNGRWYQAQTNGTATTGNAPTHTDGSIAATADGISWKDFGTGDAVWSTINVN